MSATTPEERIQPAQIAKVLVETHIAAAPDAVWRGLIDDIGQWWPQDFYAGGEEGRRSFTLEEKVGGRMFEEWEGGGGVLWGTVQSFDPGKLLQLSGMIFPEWGGPKLWFGSLSLAADDDGTRVRFQDAAVGQVDPAKLEQTSQGWDYLFCRCLKAHIEGAPAPSWTD